MRPTIRPADVESWGVPLKPAQRLAAEIDQASRRYPGPLDPRTQERLWLKLRSLLLTNPNARWQFPAHLALYHLAYEGRRQEDGPGPAWVPSKSDLHSSNIGRMTYGQLHRLSSRIANGLDALGLRRGERIALFLPMTPEAVATYIGIVLSGRCVVGIADAAAPPEFQKRVRIADAHAVFTVDSYLRDGKVHDIYSKVIEADGPQAVVISRTGEKTRTARNDIAWTDFLSDRDTYDAVRGRPSDHTNILFSSGTTKDPKAIPWTQTTPIKSAADAYLHQDVRPSDVLAWPTSFGWMMGPWLTYASLVDRKSTRLNSSH